MEVWPIQTNFVHSFGWFIFIISCPGKKYFGYVAGIPIKRTGSMATLFSGMQQRRHYTMIYMLYMLQEMLQGKPGRQNIQSTNRQD